MFETIREIINKKHEQKSAEIRGGSSFFPRGGGVDPTTMRSIVHEPRSGEPIFFFGAILNPRK